MSMFGSTRHLSRISSFFFWGVVYACMVFVRLIVICGSMLLFYYLPIYVSIFFNQRIFNYKMVSQILFVGLLESVSPRGVIPTKVGPLTYGSPHTSRKWDSY